MRPINAVGSFGNWLRNQICQNEINVHILAYDIGLSVCTVSNHLNMKRFPSFPTIKRYCSYFGEDDPYYIYELVLSDKQIAEYT